MPTKMAVKLMPNKDKHDTASAANLEVKLERHDTKITKSMIEDSLINYKVPKNTKKGKVAKNYFPCRCTTSQ